MTRRLSLQTPLVFEPVLSPFLRRLMIPLLLAPGFLFGSLAISNFTGVLLIAALVAIGLLSIAFFLYAFDGMEGKVIVDADGLEWRSPLKKKRLLWNEGLRLKTKQFYSRGGVFRVHYVSSANTTISFGENLRNHPYLLSIIDAGINHRADKNSVVPLPLAPIDAPNSALMDTMVLVSVFLFVGAFIFAALLFDEAKVLYFTPSVKISDIGQYANKDTEIRIRGKLHAEPPVVARDEQHSYGFQFVELEGPRRSLMSVVIPPEFTIAEGAAQSTVRAIHMQPRYFGKANKTIFQDDWQKSEVGKLVATNVDKHFKEYEKALPTKDHNIAVWNLEQDQPVEVVGYVKSENGASFIQPTDGSLFWIMPSPNKQLEREFLIKALLMGGTLGLGLLLMTAAYFEAKKAEQIMADD